MELTYYLASSFDNRNDYVPMLNDLIQKNIPGMRLSMDWGTIGNEFLDLEFINSEEKLLARNAIRDTEIKSIRMSHLFILALPGGIGSFFEYGLAYGLRKPIIVYSPSMAIAEDGHFIGMAGTFPVVGDTDKLIGMIREVKATMFAKMLQ